MTVRNKDGELEVKSADLGLGTPLSVVEDGHIEGVNNVYVMKVLDLEALQPMEPSECSCIGWIVFGPNHETLAVLCLYWMFSEDLFIIWIGGRKEENIGKWNGRREERRK